MKKHLISLMVVVVLAIILTSCGQGETEADSTRLIGEEHEGATELLFWTFQELHINFFESAIIRWNEEHPDRPIALKAETYPYDNMHNNLLLSLQSGKGAPDLVDIELGRFPNFLQGEPQLEPMNEYVEPLLDQFVSSRFDVYAKDGVYYGLPTHVGATVMYYNQAIMDEAGVDIDQIETWEDYVEAGKQVVANTDAVMTTVETNDYWAYWPMLKQQGSDFFDANGQVTLDHNTNIDTLQFLQDLIYDHEIAMLTPGGDHHAEEYYGFMNDEGAASVMMPMWYMGRFTDYMEDLNGKMRIRPLPRWEEGGDRSAGAGGTGTVVTNQSEHADLAKEFLAFAKLSEQGNIDLWRVLGFDPPRWDVWDSPEMLEDNQYYEYFNDDIFDILLEMRDEIESIHINEHNPLVQQQLTINVLNNVLRQRSQSPEEALKEAADEIRDLQQNN
ncbi:ABC transporter substrate-binding protein [Caldalkalibacillus salinus]|uniref:ABC transporter substrate-binding protein n=1 Tax=Caldalkalibacillus salinus TaxID=2803787 RepID=UPI001925115D|nr:ABC transporter substrate-binding protein [Caldalkalibacillus salinus]